MSVEQTSAAEERGRGGGGGGGQGPWSTRLSVGNYDPSSGAGYVSVPGRGPVGFGL